MVMNVIEMTKLFFNQILEYEGLEERMEKDANGGDYALLIWIGKLFENLAKTDGKPTEINSIWKWTDESFMTYGGWSLGSAWVK